METEYQAIADLMSKGVSESCDRRSKAMQWREYLNFLSEQDSDGPCLDASAILGRMEILEAFLQPDGPMPCKIPDLLAKRFLRDVMKGSYPKKALYLSSGPPDITNLAPFSWASRVQKSCPDFELIVGAPDERMRNYLSAFQRAVGNQGKVVESTDAFKLAIDEGIDAKIGCETARTEDEILYGDLAETGNPIDFFWYDKFVLPAISLRNSRAGMIWQIPVFGEGKMQLYRMLSPISQERKLTDRLVDATEIINGVLCSK